MKNGKKKAKVLGVVQARMGSKRLPEKVLAPIVGRPMLWHIVNRLRYATLIDKVVIATSSKEKDRPIRIMAEENGIPYYAGSEEDLLDRFYGASKMFGATEIVRVTADCPLVDPKIMDELVAFFLRHKDQYEYVSNARPFASYPHGLDVEIFSVSLLERLWRQIKDPFKREWFTPLIVENPQRYRIFCMRNDRDLSHIRLTVDYPEDLELVRYIYKNLYSEDRCFYLDDILDLLSKNKKMLNVNAKYKRDEQYASELKNRRAG